MLELELVAVFSWEVIEDVSGDAECKEALLESRSSRQLFWSDIKLTSSPCLSPSMHPLSTLLLLST